MKKLLFIPIFFIALNAYSQESENNTAINKNAYTQLPNEYSYFINDSNISWAASYNTNYSY
jgi:hypothetical protein